MEYASLTLHHYPGTRSARVLWLLHEIYGEALDPRITVRKVQLYEGEHYRPPFTDLNPNRSVPVLEIEFGAGVRGDGLTPMIESGAIVGFLADAHPEAGLAPPCAATPERALHAQMMDYAAGHMDAQLTVLLYQCRLLKEEDRDPKTEARARKKIAEEIEPFLLKRLAAASYFGGARFSAVDCLMGHNVEWGRAFGCLQDEAFAAYAARMRERPAYRAAFADAKG